MGDNYQLDVALVACADKIRDAVEELQAVIGAGFEIDVSMSWIDITAFASPQRQTLPRVCVTASRSSP